MAESSPAAVSAAALQALPPNPSPELEALKGGIMAEIEMKLSEKEHHLWKRGQVEIKRLQQEQQQVKECIGQMQGRQDSLLEENKQIRGALVEVTTRFELVVKEMREVLRALPQQRSDGTSLGTQAASAVLQPSPSPSVASTAVSEVLREETNLDISYETLGGSAERTRSRTTPSTEQRNQNSPTAENTKAAAAELRMDEDIGNVSQTFCTPPRNGAASAQDSSLDTGLATNPAVLSLANSLPPTSTASSTPNPSPGACKRLQLAECLTGGQASAASPSPSSSRPAAVAAAPPTPPQRRTEPVAPALAAGPVPPSPARNFDFLNVEIVKEPGFVTLGIEVNQVDGVSLRVESIDEHGLVGRYNARQEDRGGSRVLVGDRVIEVNGVGQDPNEMLKECKVRQRLCFTIARDSRRVSLQGASDAAAASTDEHSAEEEPAGAASSSPVATRMRPEASVFVPASQATQEVSAAPPLVLPAVAVVPPGFESYDTSGFLKMPTGPALGTQFVSMLEAAEQSAAMAAAAGVGIHVTSPMAALGITGVSASGVAFDEEEEEVKRALFH